MINDFISAVCIAINTEFGDSYEIYTETIEQGLQEPCFFVQCINPSISKEMTNRKLNSLLFMVQYFPESNTDAYAEINDVIERLYSCLASIDYKGVTVEGSDIDKNVNDKVLNFNITYDFHTVITSDDEKMESYTMKEGLNNG